MSLEVPPPVNQNNPQEWSEQLVDYLIRQFAEIDQRLNDIEARLDALETP